MDSKTTKALLGLSVLLLIGIGVVIGIFISPDTKVTMTTDIAINDLNKLIQLQQQAIAFNECVQLIVNDNNSIMYIPLWQAISNKTQVPLGDGIFQNIKVYSNIVCIDK